MLSNISAFWARIELFFAACLAFIVTVLIFLNVVTRTLGTALFWVDELAIYTMVWMTFLGASAAIHYGHSVSITFLTNNLPFPLKTIAKHIVNLLVLVFSLFMIGFCWRWFSPLQLALNGFDFESFQGNTFNFIYAEPTTTLGIKKYIVWLVMWLFAIGATLHSLSNLLNSSPMETKHL